MFKSIFALLMIVLLVKSSTTIGRNSDENDGGQGHGQGQGQGQGHGQGQGCPPCSPSTPPPPQPPLCGAQATATNVNSVKFGQLFAILQSIDCSQFSPLLLQASLETNVAALKSSHLPLVDRVTLIASSGVVLADTLNPNPTTNLNTRLSVALAHLSKNCVYGWESMYNFATSSDILYVTKRCETPGYGFLTGAPVIRLQHNL